MSRPKVYTWGEWRFEPHEYRLARGGEPVTAAMKSLDLLALLISRAPRLATKADILSTVWPDAAVEEGNIAFHVAALRKLLDAEGQPTCIETVRGRGYRFVAPVESTPVIIPPSTQSLDLPPEIRAIGAAPQRSWIRPAAATALAVAITGVLGFLVYRAVQPDPIAIAPFAVSSGTVADDNFGASVTQVVVAELSEAGVRAIPIDSGTSGETPRAAAARLGADAVLTGEVTQASDQRWEVSLRLLRADDGAAVWAWSFIAPSNEHSQQEEIAKRAADGLKSYLSLSGTAAVTR